MLLSRISMGAVAVAGAAVLATPARAGLVDFGIQVSDGTSLMFTEPGVMVGPDLFNYQGSRSGAAWDITWDFDGDPNPSGGALVGSVFDISNNSTTQTLEFEIQVTLRLDSGAAPPVDYGGSAGYNLVGEDATLATLPGSALWEALADGVEVAELWPDPFSLSFTGQSTRQISQNLTPGVIGAVSDSIGYRLNFSLTPGDSVAVGGVFGIIPGPSALALLGIGGLLGGRRRRR